MRYLSPFIWMLLLVGVVIGAPRADAQDAFDYVGMTQDFLDAYFSDTNEDITRYMAADASSELDFCSEPERPANPTHMKAELVRPYDPEKSFMPLLGIVRVTSDVWTILVVFGEDDNSQHPYFIQQVVCEGSPAARTLEMLAADEISPCAQDFLTTIWARKSWVNREGNRALVRVETNFTPFTAHVIYVYLTRENDTWMFDQEICNHLPEGLALGFFTQYMMERAAELDPYNPSVPFYYLGSPGLPIYADVTSVRVDRDWKGPAIVTIQLENQDTDLPDFICVVAMKVDLESRSAWIIYDLRCTDASSSPQ